MAYETKSFPLDGKLKGISDNQLQQHRDILYKGYVAKLNEITDALKDVDRSRANGIYSIFGELKREETFALNGTYLHELYFENLGGDGGSPKGKIAEMITNEFGSFDKFKEDFRACGVSARGWVILAYNFYDKKLHNYLLDTHHFHVPIGVWPLLVMDVYEHAYAIDFGVKRPPYLDAFFDNICWDTVNKRLDIISKML